jgi:tRNA/tmRNA/rRNA uracil-C5-methylase (TrmA/RlmC/RlmD family)
MTHRIRIKINKSLKYYDLITNNNLLNYINTLLPQIYHIDYNYILFQKSIGLEQDYYGFIIYLKSKEKDDTKKITEFIENIILENIQVKGIFHDDNLIFINNNYQIENKILDEDMKINLLSFTQPDEINGNIIRKYANEFLYNSILNNNFNFYGLGGESCLYTKKLHQNFKKCYTFTNSNYIYQDNITNTTYINNIHNYLVNYDEFNINSFIDKNINNILLVNISEKGLKNLAHNINNIKFSYIIYIGCNKKYIKKDFEILDNYIIQEKKKIQFITNNFGYVYKLVNKFL